MDLCSQYAINKTQDTHIQKNEKNDDLSSKCNNISDEAYNLNPIIDLLMIVPELKNNTCNIISKTSLEATCTKIINFSDIEEKKLDSQDRQSVLTTLTHINPVDLMLKLQGISMEICSKKVELMKESNEINLKGQNALEQRKLEEYKSQIEEQEKAEEQAKKAQILNSVVGWLGVALTAVAAIFNPVLWSAFALATVAMALTTSANHMENPPDALKKASIGLKIISDLFTLIMSFGCTAVVKAVPDILQKLPETLTKVATKIAEKLGIEVAQLMEKIVNKAISASSTAINVSAEIGKGINDVSMTKYQINAEEFKYQAQYTQTMQDFMKLDTSMQFEKIKREINNHSEITASASKFLTQDISMRLRISTQLA